jgi:hypothetical protein
METLGLLAETAHLAHILRELAHKLVLVALMAINVVDMVLV